MKHLRTLFASALVVFASAANAAEIKRYAGEDGSTVISITGRLVDGDDRRFSLLTFGVERGTVLLDSTGGNLVAALTIGKETRQNGFDTVVAPRAICASGCALIWLAGQERMLHGSSYVGLHSTFLQKDGRKIASARGNYLVAAYLKRLGYKEKLVRYATAADPTDMRWLNFVDANALGIAFSTDLPDLTMADRPEPAP